MLSTSAIAIVVVSVIVLLSSGWWTDRTYQRFDHIPAHYDIRGNATRLTPRRPMAWAIPIGFSVFLIGLALVIEYIPPELQNGDPSLGIIAASIIMVIAQGFILLLLSRWAARQQ